MKLTSTQIEQTLGQFEAKPIPEDHPMVPQLNEVFGEHTYFVNSDGLIILEPAGSGLTGVVSAKVVNLEKIEGRRHHAPWNFTSPRRRTL